MQSGAARSPCATNSLWVQVASGSLLYSQAQQLQRLHMDLLGVCQRSTLGVRQRGASLERICCSCSDQYILAVAQWTMLADVSPCSDAATPSPNLPLDAIQHLFACNRPSNLLHIKQITLGCQTSDTTRRKAKRQQQLCRANTSSTRHQQSAAIAAVRTQSDVYSSSSPSSPPLPRFLQTQLLRSAAGNQLRFQDLDAVIDSLQTEPEFNVASELTC
jgi:hypothetical protein